MYDLGDAPPVGPDRNGRPILIGSLVATWDERCGRVLDRVVIPCELDVTLVKVDDLGWYLLEQVAVLPNRRT